MADETQHQALYRRYRPQTPAELIGQDHVVRALTGSIREDRLHHAFLFCGPRGTGKTSTARILAKMVNCEQAPTAEPCGTCEQCVAIREGTHVDVVEIDAASHGGVDDARDLREKAPTAAMLGREKVYIIDEAQRLSREAFDALLKLFEEPPPGVRFVLATTEPHKMPATIVGRCQRFDFRRLTLEDLSAHLVRIADRRGRRRSTRSRRTRSPARPRGRRATPCRSWIRPRCSAGDVVDDATIRALLGAPRAEVQHEVADVVAVGDVRGAFEVIGRLVQDGQDLRNVTGEALGHFRDLLLMQTAPGQQDLLDIPADAYDSLRIQADKFTVGELARIIDLLLAAQNDMRWTTSPRLTLGARAGPGVRARDRPDARGRRGAARAPRAPGQRQPRRGRRARGRRAAPPDARAEPAADAAAPTSGARRREHRPRRRAADEPPNAQQMPVPARRRRRHASTPRCSAAPGRR